jgi:hypothetical protein
MIRLRASWWNTSSHRPRDRIPARRGHATGRRTGTPSATTDRQRAATAAPPRRLDALQAQVKLFMPRGQPLTRRGRPDVPDIPRPPMRGVHDLHRRRAEAVFSVRTYGDTRTLYGPEISAQLPSPRPANQQVSEPRPLNPRTCHKSGMTATARSGPARGSRRSPAIPNLSSWPAGRRVIVRKERPNRGAQLRFTNTDGHQFTASAASTKGGQLGDIELCHRCWARCEDRIRTGKRLRHRQVPVRLAGREQRLAVRPLDRRDLPSLAQAACPDAAWPRPSRRPCVLARPPPDRPTTAASVGSTSRPVDPKPLTS